MLSFYSKIIMETKAVIYARVSSESDRQDTSKKNEERVVLTECLEYCRNNSVEYLLLSELSRLGRSTLQVLKSLDILHEAKVSVYIQNLGLYTLQKDGKVNPIVSILITILAEMSNIERSNIEYRLNSGRKNYIMNGGKLGRKKGSIKTEEKMKDEYKETIILLKKGYSIRNIAKLQGIGISTVQRIKNQFINNKE